MNSFQRFGIDHLSPSSLNKWMTDPGWWAWHYIAGNRDETSAAAVRGQAIENGLAIYLMTGDEEAAVIGALNLFDKAIPVPGNPEREMIGPAIRNLWKWKPPSQLNAAGCFGPIRIEHYFDHIPVPIIGFVDFAFDGIDIDCKTVKQCPSSLGPWQMPHVRQVSLYRAARGRNGGLLYVTDKRHAYYEVDDRMMEEGLKQLHHAALSLNNLLARCETKDDVLRSLPRNPDSFYAPKIKELVA